MKGAFTGFGGEIAKVILFLAIITVGGIGYVLFKQGLDYIYCKSFRDFVVLLLKYDAIGAVLMPISIIVERLFFKQKARD